MLKKRITYTDYDGNERTEDFYFNLSKAEILEMEYSTVGGMQKKMETIIATKDSKRLIEVFKGIILDSYGEKTPDGRHFIKVDENGHRLANKFMQTEAYTSLFMELAFDDKAASEFINGIIPASENKNDALQVTGN